MWIAVNHLTRMDKGYLCFAGLDQEGKHIRPVLPGSQRLGVNLLARHGGVLDMAYIVDLGGTGALPRPPAIEDTVFSHQNLAFIAPLEADRFWELLAKNASTSMQSIFGTDLKPKENGRWRVAQGRGAASLGGYRPPVRPHLFVRERQRDGKTRVRIRWEEDGAVFDLGVTDIRLYQDDHDTPDEKLVRGANERIQEGTEILLGVGLTRPFSPDPLKEQPSHWLQVTNIHFKSNPVWRLG